VAIGANSFVHFINRDANEKYVVIHTGSGMEAWNIVTGVKCSMNGSTSALTPPSYLTTTTPRESLKALTVADNTFIVNKDVTASLSQTKTPALDKKGFVYIAQGDYEKKYEVTIGGNISGAVASTVATFDVTVGDKYYGSGWEMFYISDVSITNAGEGYPAGTPTTLTVNIDFGDLGGYINNQWTYNNLVVQPIISITLVDDGTGNGTKKVGSVSINEQGTFGQHDTQVSGGDFAFDYNASVSLAVQGDIATGATHVFSTVGTRNTVAADASTDNIAKVLLNNSYEAFHFTTVAFNSDTIFDPNGANHLTATREGYSIIIEHNEVEGDFSLTTDDGLGGSGIKGIYKRTSSLADLPTKAPNNFVVEVVGDAELDQDNYWVQFTTNSGLDYGDGAWEETVAPNISEGFDINSMPMTIRSTNLNTLEVVSLDYTKRVAGDEETNPNPSFVGKTINDIVFFKNRLGFITDDSVVFSEAGEFFNFYRTTVSSLLDSGPIDITVSSTKVTKLKSATIFQENLMLFADNVQFVMKGGDLFTPKTVSVSPTTNFSLDDSVSPTPLGSYVYFPFTRGSYTGLRELALSANTETYDAVEVTEHVPAYVPSNIIAMAGTTSEDVIALLSGTEKGSLYIYNYFWNNNQKVLSAWSKFTFTGEIRGIEFIDSTLYMVITNNDETTLVEMPLESGLSDAAGYVTHLDMRVAHKVHMRNFRFTGATGVAAHLNNINYSYDFEINGAQGYHSVPPSPEDSQILRGADGKWYLYELGGVTYAMSTAGYTQYPWDADWTGTALANATFSFNGARDTINLPYTPEDNSVEVYTTDGLALNCTNSGSRVTLTNPLSADTDVWVGIPYTMKYTFSEQLFKAKAGNGKSPSNAAKMRIRNGSVYYAESAYFKVKVTPKFRDTYENIFTPDVVGSSTLGSLTLGSGFYRFPVFTKPLDTTITIENESALPSTFQSAEFESFVHTRSNRYG
jgi:hypothetical protein